MLFRTTNNAVRRNTRHHLQQRQSDKRFPDLAPHKISQMPFQLRKNLHMLFLALLVALCFHSVNFRYVGSILLVWYALDRFYFTTKQ